VAGELYRVPPLVLSRVEEREPPGLYRGRVRLEDGREVWGILYPEHLAAESGRDISEFGGWRAFLAG
jgi:allophanate hydrolase